MKTKNFFKIGICLFISVIFFSCGGGGGDVVDSLIPDLSANWTNTADATDEFFFPDVANPGKATSTFTGNNNFPQGEQHTFSGSYTNSKISFTFNDGPRKDQKFSGTIKGTAPTATMTLTTPSGTITLLQHP